MFLKKKPVKRCYISPNYFWLIKTKKHGIVNVSGAKGNLKKITGNKAIVDFDDYGKQSIPTSLIIIK